MLINTHVILANNIYLAWDSKKRYLINKNRFIWGNVKPDCVSKYKYKKHYLDESKEMIILKIKELSKLSTSEVILKQENNKFSEELGVICHFLCDYFCLPHYERWEFKNSMKKHVSYERTLGKIAKIYKPTKYIVYDLSIDNIEEFLDYNLRRYKGKQSFKADLEYAYLMCNSIMNLLLNEVVKNEYMKQRRAV